MERIAVQISTQCAEKEAGLPQRFSLSPSGHLLQASLLVALSPVAVLTAVYCTAGAGRCWGQGRVVGR